MEDRTRLALEASRQLRQSAAFRGLGAAEQEALGRDLGRIERTLAGGRRADPYSLAQATPADLQRDLAGSGGIGSARGDPAAPPAPAAPPPRPQRNVDQFGRTTAEAVEAVNFPGFVAGLVHGTFQAIVDATAQQLREYADLVASLSRSLDDFARDNVSADQTKSWLASRHPADLRHEAPPPGKSGASRLVPAAQASGQSPAWLAQYDLSGQELTAELTAGPLLEAGQKRLAEERLQTLASMVLMGINRIVVNDGDIRAKVQIFAVARDKTDAEMAVGAASQGPGIAGRSTQSSTPSMMVQTVRGNAQADANIKVNLTGEVRISFRTETFPLERFADSAAIQLLNRHARWRGDEPAAAAPAAAAPPAPPERGPT
jgi:hypothetical protein